MRHAIAAVFLVLCLAAAGPPTNGIGDAAIATLHAQPAVEIQIGDDPWYQQPVWISIMVIGAIVMVVLVLMALRGRGSRL